MTACLAVTKMGTRCRHPSLASILRERGFDPAQISGDTALCDLHRAIEERQRAETAMRRRGQLTARERDREIRRLDKRVAGAIAVLGSPRISQERLVRAIRVLSSIDPAEWRFVYMPFFAKSYRVIRREFSQGPSWPRRLA